MSRPKLIRAIVAFAVACCSADASRAATYSILNLGTLGGSMSFAGGYGTVNNAGQVVGDAHTAGNSIRAFRTAANGVITAPSNLGTLGGTSSLAYSINASGQAVGFSYTSGDVAKHAFRTAPNGVITVGSDLGTLGGEKSTAQGINASGQAVGWSDMPGGTGYHAFRTAPNGVITADSDLGTLGGPYSIATGINASGQVVGYARSAGLRDTAFRTVANGTITAGSVLGTLGGLDSRAFGINDAGQAVGYSTTAGGATRAFRTAANAAITAGSDLGTLGGTNSYAYAINASGQTVGSSYITGTTTEHAFFVGVTGPMVDLNTLLPTGSGWVLEGATGINDLGQISGYGTIGGLSRAFLLTPVPEPTTLAAFAAAGVVACRRRRVTRARAASVTG